MWNVSLYVFTHFSGGNQVLLARCTISGNRWSRRISIKSMVVTQVGANHALNNSSVIIKLITRRSVAEVAEKKPGRAEVFFKEDHFLLSLLKQLPRVHLGPVLIKLHRSEISV